MGRHVREYSTEMASGDVEFQFRWVPALLLLIAVPLFVRLGLWQLDRADQKRERAEVLAERAKMPPLDLVSPVGDPEPLRFRILRAHGVYEPEGQILIDNRHYGTRLGFHVITPLRIAGSDRRVLVNRGWIPAGPDGAPAPAPVPHGEVEVTGQTHIPLPPAIVLGGDSQAARGWGDRWPYLTIDLYAARAPYPVEPVVILQDPDDPDGFVRIWPQELPKEGMHIGYAIQWFAFAAIALVLTVIFSLRRRPGAEVEA